MNVIRNRAGFSLIELLFVMAIISLLAAIAIPAYLGFQDRARTAQMMKAARGALPELQFWLQLSLSTRPDNREADTNFDGRIDAGDKTNAQLLADGVASTYAINRNIALHENSPWGPFPLWNDDNSMPPGRISLIQNPLTPTRIQMVAINGRGETLLIQDAFAD